MRRKYTIRSDCFQRSREGQAIGETFTQQLQNQERRMTFIQMKDCRGNPERAQRSCAADAQDHLLAHASRFVTTIEPVRDVTIGRRVLRAVGIQQIDRNAAHLAFHSRATTSRPAIFTVTWTHSPLGFKAGSTGRSRGSRSRYSACWLPSLSTVCVK